MGWIVRTSRAALAAAALIVLGAGAGHAQGVTTASVRGRVIDQAGSPVEGAAVLLTNTSTGLRYQATSRGEGWYGIENVAVGGPYTLEARLIGHRPASRTGIYLGLGQVFDADIVLERAAVELAGVTVLAEERDRVMSAEVQGTRSTISDSILRRLPTLDREFQDFVRLTPQVAERDEGGISAAGQNNRYNTIQIDGSTVNDRFGLGRTGLTGGQAGGRAVGLDAVKEYQVLLAPYDVRQGNFTGALINAVTKSGTNDWHGSAFYYFRNQSLVGEPLSDTDFKQHQFGGSLGGPIVRDRAHFFVNVELRRRATPARGPYIGQAGTPKASQADVEAFNSALAGWSLPASGTGTLITNENPLGNFLGRLDYRVGDRSRLVLRYIYNGAQDDNFSRSTGTTFDLSTVGFHFTNSTHNPSVQFFTNFANGVSNELLFSLNRIRDKREPNVTAALIAVQNFTAADGSGFYTLQSGSERFSQGNELDQDIWELTDNLTIPMNNHRITIGTRNEIYRVRNLFAQSSYGVWTFDDLADFQSGTAERYESAGDLGGGIAATFTAGIFGLYAQDQWRATPALTITAGLRADMPVFFDEPSYDPRVAADGFNTEIPTGQVLLSPRLGFNLDLGERVMQIRGGIGMYTGTPAYVWYSNAFSNNGTKIGRITCSGANTPAFDPGLGGPLQCADGTGIVSGSTIGEVNTIGADTKFPQVLRGNLAIDRRLPGGLVATAEVLFTKGINDFFIVNRNLVEPPTTNRDPNGRLMYGTINADGTTSPNYVDLTLYGPSFNGGVFELLNTSNNVSVAVTGQLQKRFGDGWEATLGYTYSSAKDVQSFTSSRAISNWRFGRVYSGSQLDDDETNSSFARPHRLVAGLTYSARWWSWPTDISLSYVVQSGQPYTLIASGSTGRGDLNADGTQNDPIYIPRDVAAEMTFVDISGRPAAQQAAEFEAYIAGEPCLIRQRGRIMERNSCRNPAQHFLNLTVRQSLPQFAPGTLSLELGIFNVLNFINDDWGQVKSVDAIVFNEYEILRLIDAPGGVPRYQLDYNPANSVRFEETSSLLNSYQVQVALRYGF